MVNFHCPACGRIVYAIGDGLDFAGDERHPCKACGHAVALVGAALRVGERMGMDQAVWFAELQGDDAAMAYLPSMYEHHTKAQAAVTVKEGFLAGVVTDCDTYLADAAAEEREQEEYRRGPFEWRCLCGQKGGPLSLEEATAAAANHARACPTAKEHHGYVPLENVAHGQHAPP